MTLQLERFDQTQAPKVDTYKEWQAGQGIPVIRGFYVPDIKTVEVAPWELKGGRGAFINLDGAGGTNDAYVCEIPPGEKLKPQKHLYEEMIYIASGRGATTVWQRDGNKQMFEWQRGSLFAIPLNAWHQHFNGSGTEPARYLAVTNLPFIMNLFHNPDFVFKNDFTFKDRFDPMDDDYFSSRGKLYGRSWLSINFVADTHSLELSEQNERGPGARNMKFDLAGQIMAAHVSEFAVGTYKKAHRHGPCAHVLVLSGKGYSLMWREGEAMQRFDWGPGSLVVPPDRWFHQHFNAGTESARYLALRWGSKKFFGLMGEGSDRTLTSIKLGGDQIEYEDEDQIVRRMFEEALAQAGIESRMAPFYAKK